MSYMKQHLMSQAVRTPLYAVVDYMQAAERVKQREDLERLAWEARRAMDAYLDALTEFEKARNGDLGHRADAPVNAELPF